MPLDSRRPPPAVRPSLPAAPLEVERDHAIQALSLHYANDLLTDEDFEDRLERAYRATAPAQLDALFVDLPGAVVHASGGATPHLAPAREVPPRGVVIAVMGGSERAGSWLVPRHLKVFVLLGGTTVDMREARFAVGVTEVEVTVIMGGAEIIVPPGVRVECVGSALIGGFGATAGDVSSLGPAQPILRISGIVVMGGVDVKTRAPGESTDEDDED
jgi:hypothetical protein